MAIKKLESKTSDSKTILGLVILILGSISFYYFAIFEGALELAFQAMLHWTGRLSLVLFLCIYLASPFARLKLNLGRSLVRNRRTLGISIGVSHILHLFCLNMYLNLPGSEMPSQVFQIFGLFGVVVLALMVITSNDFSVRLLGRFWKLLHSLGLMYLWLTFTMIYAPEAVYTKEVLPVTVTSVLILAAGFRIFTSATGRRTT